MPSELAKERAGVLHIRPELKKMMMMKGCSALHQSPFVACSRTLASQHKYYINMSCPSIEPRTLYQRCHNRTVNYLFGTAFAVCVRGGGRRSAEKWQSPFVIRITEKSCDGNMAEPLMLSPGECRF